MLTWSFSSSHFSACSINEACYSKKGNILRSQCCLSSVKYDKCWVGCYCFLLSAKLHTFMWRCKQRNALFSNILIIPQIVAVKTTMDSFIHESNSRLLFKGISDNQASFELLSKVILPIIYIIYANYAFVTVFITTTNKLNITYILIVKLETYLCPFTIHLTL